MEKENDEEHRKTYHFSTITANDKIKFKTKEDIDYYTFYFK